MIPWLADTDLKFPPIESALDEPNGLLAAGDDLTWRHLLCAYCEGIFPWYNHDDPVLWWSPNPRAVVFPAELYISKSLRKTLRKTTLQVTYDHAFKSVMMACAEPRNYTDSTWISEEIIAAYTDLHKRGIAHSVEVWEGEKLVGGLYGVSLGKIFFGESMFSRVTDASKIGFVHLVTQLQQWGYSLIDCQVASDHLASLGARTIPREDFKRHLSENIDKPYFVSLAHRACDENLLSTATNWSTIKTDMTRITV